MSMLIVQQKYKDPQLLDAQRNNGTELIWMDLVVYIFFRAVVLELFSLTAPCYLRQRYTSFFLAYFPA